MKQAMNETEEVTKPDLEVWVIDGADTEEILEINRQLYTLLATKTFGEPKLMVQNTPQGMGLEAWRKLNRRFGLRSKGLSNAGMKAIM
eukprot:7368016-Lingulodinium_polyedra.AAC.1